MINILGRRRGKRCELIFIQFYKFKVISHINCNSISAFLCIAVHSVLLAAVLCGNVLCKQDALLQNFQNFKIIFFFILIYFYKLGKIG